MGDSEVPWGEAQVPENGIWGTWRVTRVRGGCPELGTRVPGCRQGKEQVPMAMGDQRCPRVRLVLGAMVWLWGV